MVASGHFGSEVNTVTLWEVQDLRFSWQGRYKSRSSGY